MNLTIPGRDRQVKVFVRAGVINGQRFVYRGAAKRGLDGGPAGDLHVVLSIR